MTLTTVGTLVLIGLVAVLSPILSELTGKLAVPDVVIDTPPAWKLSTASTSMSAPSTPGLAPMSPATSQPWPLRPSGSPRTSAEPSRRGWAPIRRPTRTHIYASVPAARQGSSDHTERPGYGRLHQGGEGRQYIGQLCSHHRLP